jgi:hypothetical protein
MKLLTLIFILVFSFSVFGQTEKFSLNVKSNYQSAPFNSEIEKLPPVFQGHNALDMFQILLSFAKEVDAGCGKFEKSEICQARLNKMYDRPISGKLKASDKLAFSVPVDCEYSADRERIKCADYPYHWLQTKTEGKPYIAQNAFGVKAIVKSRKFENLYIKTDKITPQFILENYPPEKAQKLLPFLRCLVVGTLLQPFADLDSVTYDATLKDPVRVDVNSVSIVVEAEEIWLYDFVSGKVLAKEKFGDKK